MDELNRFANQLGKDPAALRGLLTSPDAQALLRLLTAKNQGQNLQQAAQAAMRGDSSAISALLNQVGQTPGGVELLQRLQRSAGQ